MEHTQERSHIKEMKKIGTQKRRKNLSNKMCRECLFHFSLVQQDLRFSTNPKSEKFNIKYKLQIKSLKYLHLMQSEHEISASDTRKHQPDSHTSWEQLCYHNSQIQLPLFQRSLHLLLHLGGQDAEGRAGLVLHLLVPRQVSHPQLLRGGKEDQVNFN